MNQFFLKIKIFISVIRLIIKYFRWKRLLFLFDHDHRTTVKEWSPVHLKLIQLEEEMFYAKSAISADCPTAIIESSKSITSFLSQDEYDLVQFCLNACDVSYQMREMPIYQNPEMGIVVYSYERYFIVCFTGTRIQHGVHRFFNDIKADLCFWQRSMLFASGKLHSGFLSEFFERNHALQVDQVLHHFDKHQQQLIFTGHSLGASLAIIAGYYYQYFKPKIVGFGVPSAIGNEVITKSMWDRRYDHLLFVHENDPVDMTRALANVLLIGESSYANFSEVSIRMNKTLYGFTAHALQSYRQSLTQENINE